MPIRPLAEDVVMLALHPTRPRRPHANEAIRTAMRMGMIIDEVLAGAPVPTRHAMRHTLRVQARRTLDLWLDPLIAEGRVARDGRRSRWFARRHLLLDGAARTAAQERLYAALTPAPDFRCAALAVLAGHASLLAGAVRDEDPVEPLAAAAHRLATGATVPAGPHALTHFADTLAGSSR